MFNQLSGATRLFPIIRLTRTFGERGQRRDDDRLAARLHSSVESCPRLLMAYSHGRNSGDGIDPCSKPLADSNACAILAWSAGLRDGLRRG